MYSSPETFVKLKVRLSLELLSSNPGYAKRYEASATKSINEAFGLAGVRKKSKLDYPVKMTPSSFASLQGGRWSLVLTKSFTARFRALPDHIIKIKDRTWTINPITTIEFSCYGTAGYCPTVWLGDRVMHRSQNKLTDLKTSVQELAEEFSHWQVEEKE